MDERTGAVWTKIRACLEGERDRVRTAISAYPRPIPACDVQFNYLLEQRAAITRELQRFDDAIEQGAAAVSPESFIAACPWMDDEAKERLVIT